MFVWSVAASDISKNIMAYFIVVVVVVLPEMKVLLFQVESVL